MGVQNVRLELHISPLLHGLFAHFVYVVVVLQLSLQVQADQRLSFGSHCSSITPGRLETSPSPQPKHLGTDVQVPSAWHSAVAGPTRENPPMQLNVAGGLPYVLPPLVSAVPKLICKGGHSLGTQSGTGFPHEPSGPHVRSMLESIEAKTYPELQLYVAVLPKTVPSGVAALPFLMVGVEQLTRAHVPPSPVYPLLQTHPRIEFRPL